MEDATLLLIIGGLAVAAFAGIGALIWLAVRAPVREDFDSDEGN